MDGIQQNKRFQIDFSGTISKAMSKNLLRNMTNVRSKEKFKKYRWTSKHCYQNWGNTTEVDGFKHLVDFMEYFSKWSEAKPIKLLGLHGCFLNCTNGTKLRDTYISMDVWRFRLTTKGGSCEWSSKVLRNIFWYWAAHNFGVSSSIKWALWMTE